MIYSRKAEVQTEVSAFNYFWFSFKFELFNVHQSLMFMSFIFVYLYGGIDQFFHCPLSTLLLPDPISSFRLTKTTRWLGKQTDTSTRFQVPPLHPRMFLFQRGGTGIGIPVRAAVHELWHPERGPRGAVFRPVRLQTDPEGGQWSPTTSLNLID